MCDLNAIGTWLVILETLLITENILLASVTTSLLTLFGAHPGVIITAMVIAGLAAAAVAKILSLINDCTKVCGQISSLKLNLTRIATALATQLTMLLLLNVFPASFLAAAAIFGALTIESGALAFIPGDITSLGSCPGGTSGSLRAASTLSMVALVTTIAEAALMSTFWLAHQF